MNKKKIYLIALVLLIWQPGILRAQSIDCSSPLNDCGRVLVSDHATTHLIFDSNISYVDIGINNFVVDTVKNMVKVKHRGKDLLSYKNVTNLTVITEKGDFYSINIDYYDLPNVLTYLFSKPIMKVESFDVQEVDTLTNTDRCADLLLAKENIKKVKASRKMVYKVNGFYYIGDKIHIRIKVTNASDINYTIDDVLFRLRASKSFKRRYTYQEKVLLPIAKCNYRKEIAGKSSNTFVAIFDRFVPLKHEHLAIDLIELGGGRRGKIRLNSLLDLDSKQKN